MKRVQDRWKCICQTSLQILIYTFLLLLSPLLIILLCLLWVYKNGILRLIVKYFKPKLLQGLNEAEAFYASDQFWGDSRSSTALVLTLNGNVDLEQIREDFLNQVVLAYINSSPSGSISTFDESDKLFPRLTQIPQSFGGYYFWQRANYFLIHEHIRPIKSRIYEADLKKFAGTVLTLPYPNKRPLWEILVFPSYDKHPKEKDLQGEEVPQKDDLKKVNFAEDGEEDQEKTTPIIKSKYSALVIRMHASIGDPDTMMRMIALLCNRNTFSLHSLKLPDCVSDATIPGNNGSPLSTSPTCDQDENLQPNRDALALTRIRNLIKIPRNIHNFLKSYFQTPSSSLRDLYQSESNNPTSVSWSGVNYPLISKLVQGTGAQSSGIILTYIILALRNGLPSLQIQSSSERKDGDCEAMNNGEMKPNYVTTPIMHFTKCEKNPNPDKHLSPFTFLQCGDYLLENESLARLRDINDQIVSDKGQSLICHRWLKLLTLFPHSFLRWVNLHWGQGAIILFQEGKTDLDQLLWEERRKHSLRRVSELPGNDLIFIGDHQLLDVVPVCGLLFRHSAIAATSMKFQNAIKISVTINSSLMPDVEISTMTRTTSSLRGNQIIDKQAGADEIANNFGTQMDQIFQCVTKDDHGFVRVPVTL